MKTPKLLRALGTLVAGSATLCWRLAAKVFLPRASRQLRLEPYDVANQMLRADEGWEVAPEQATDWQPGWVWLQREPRE